MKVTLKKSFYSAEVVKSVSGIFSNKLEKDINVKEKAEQLEVLGDILKDRKIRGKFINYLTAKACKNRYNG